jgi:hypothetical protein
MASPRTTLARMLRRQKCVDCGRMSPETNGENTLTTSYGWRIRKAVDSAGATAVEWRCPACWQRFKAAQATGTGAPAASHSSNPPRDPHGPDESGR